MKAVTENTVRLKKKNDSCNIPKWVEQDGTQRKKFLLMLYFDFYGKNVKSLYKNDGLLLEVSYIRCMQFTYMSVVMLGM